MPDGMLIGKGLGEVDHGELGVGHVDVAIRGDVLGGLLVVRFAAWIDEAGAEPGRRP